MNEQETKRLGGFKMTYEEVKLKCHVRSGIYRLSAPTKTYTEDDLARSHPALRDLNRVGKTVPKVYWKNHNIPLDERVPDKEKLSDDWEEYDPRERPECSAYNEVV